MKKKVTVVECDVCGFQQVERVQGDLEVLGITLNGFFAGEGGGGPIPKDLFVCIKCVRGHGQDAAAWLALPIILDVVADIAATGLSDWQERRESVT